MYSKSGTSPTKRAVAFRVNGQCLSSEAQGVLSAADRQAFVPRLFSTPQADLNFTSTPRPEGNAIEYEKVAEVVDLENEPATDNSVALSPITPFTSRRSYTSTTPANASLAGNFINVEDGLNNSVMPDESSDNLGITGALAIEASHDAEDEDCSILAEKIVNKSRNKSVNTLALEQTSCPYVEKRLFDDSKSTWKESQKRREKRFQEEGQTTNILKRGSTLGKYLEWRIRKNFTLTEIMVLEEPPEQLPPLTNEMLHIISDAKQSGNDSDILAELCLPKDTFSITRRDVRTLGGSEWLNDNVINTYMGLIVLRSKQDKYPSVYAFPTFFYPKFKKERYSNSLKRWTRKDDIFANDLIIFPIHLALHWCLACVDLRKKTIRYYDSLGLNNNKCLNLLLEYISREMKERKQIDLIASEWKLENVKGIPQQQNPSDCGMFSCKFAEYLSRDSEISFHQEDITYYRVRMIYELIKSNLLHP